MTGRRTTRTSRHRLAKALAVLGAFSMLFSITPQTARADPLRVGSELDYPPFAEVTEDGTPTGFSIELFDAVAHVLNLEHTYTVAPWSEVLADLRAGRLDVLPFVGVLPEREAFLDFSVPIVTTHGAIFHHVNGPQITAEEDLGNLRIAVMKEDVGDVYLRDQALANQVERFPSLDAAFDCVVSRQCDAVVAPRLQGQLLIGRRGLQDAIEPADIQLAGFSLHYAFAVQKGDTELLAALNGGLAIVIADGTLEELYLKWLPPIAPDPGIPVRVLLPYATALLAAMLAGLALLYMRQRRATRLAAAQGQRLEQQAEHLRALAARLESERTRAEAARAEADGLLSVMPDLFFRFDAEGRYIDCHDPGGLALVPFEQLEGRRYDELVPPDVGATVAEAMARLKESGEVQTLEYSLTLPDSEVRSFEARLVLSQDGGSLAVIRDVSEARAREQQLSRAAMAIATASAAKSRFLATLSHELRTPLNAMMGFTDVLSSEVFGPHANARYREYARDAHEAGRNLKALVDDLMDIERFESGQMVVNDSVVDLATALSSKVTLVRPLADAHGTTLDLRVTQGRHRIWADDGMVQRMVINLLSNAVTFTAGGRIDVMLEEHDDEGIAVVIADTGIGMSEEQLAHLGEPFYQGTPALARRGRGSGLGVTLIKEMIALHGGALLFDSTLGQGTTARLVFPAWRRLSGEVLNGPGLGRRQGLTS